MSSNEYEIASPTKSPMKNIMTIKFNVLPSETIDRVTHRFVKMMRQQKEPCRLIFDMSNNILIEK